MEFNLTKNTTIIKSDKFVSGLFIKINNPIIYYKLSFQYISNQYTESTIILTEDDILYYNNLQYHRPKPNKLIKSIINKYTGSNDIINNIIDYIDDEYLYYFPFGQINSNIYDNIFIDFGLLGDVTLKITTKDNLYNGTIKIKHKD